jgi:small subunit ribosomal protein S20
MRVSARKRQVNRAVVSAARTSVRRSEGLIAGGANESPQAVQNTVSALDRAAQKGVIHPNNAARRKSRLLKKLNQQAETKKAK